MFNERTLNNIKNDHFILLDEILQFTMKQQKSGSINKTTQQGLRKKAEKFFIKIEKFSNTELHLNEYTTLSKIAIQWQSIYASAFNTPIQIKLAKNNPNIIPNPFEYDVMTDDEIKNWVSMISSIRGHMRVRLTNRPSIKEDEIMDWRFAEAMFVSEVLDGRINFVKRIGKNGYLRMEKEWFKYVKCIHSYYKWEKREWELNSDSREKDYFEACEHFRGLLINQKIKASKIEFKGIAKYIAKKYLTEKGRLNKTSESVQIATGVKADRIAGTIRRYSDKKNWLLAEEYCEMYYENIIPAVMEKNETIKREKILTILKAFQYSKNPKKRLLIINCFEVAIAIYFLDSEIIKSLWEESEQRQPPSDSSFESTIESNDDTYKFKPTALKKRFFIKNKTITFIGLMTEKQKHSLLKNCENENYREVIMKLFTKSRLIHKETTL